MPLRTSFDTMGRSAATTRWENVSGAIIPANGGEYSHGSFKGFVWRVHFWMEEAEGGETLVKRTVTTLSGEAPDAMASLVEGLALNNEELEVRFTVGHYKFRGRARFGIPSSDRRVVFSFDESPASVEK